MLFPELDDPMLDQSTRRLLERAVACMAACEGVEHLTPGCVAKLVEALERIRDSQNINPDGCGHMTEGEMQQVAEQALAAMKGV